VCDVTQVKALHPAHTAASIRALLPRLKYYDNGTCIVHHIFGGEVRYHPFHNHHRRRTNIQTDRHGHGISVDILDHVLHLSWCLAMHLTVCVCVCWVCVCRQVCEIVREAYGDAYLTAHFEVPGEMFTLAMAARRRDMGVVGSTSNILDYIASKVCDIAYDSNPVTGHVFAGCEH
jgi:hypothetical protein